MTIDNIPKMVTVRRFTAAFEALGLTEPKPIATARANQRRVRNLTAPGADISPAAEAIANGTSPDKALQAAAAATHYGDALRHARELTDRRLHDSIMSNRGAILALIRDHVFTPSIERLTELAQHISPGANVGSYMENRDATKAALVIEAEDHATKLTTIYKLRRELYADTAAASLFTGEAAFVREHKGLQALNGYAPASWTDWLNLINTGVTPWFPLWDEYQALKTEHDQTPAQKAAAKQAALIAERRANSPRQPEDQDSSQMVAL